MSAGVRAAQPNRLVTSSVRAFCLDGGDRDPMAEIFASCALDEHRTCRQPEGSGVGRRCRTGLRSGCGRRVAPLSQRGHGDSDWVSSGRPSLRDRGGRLISPHRSAQGISETDLPLYSSRSSRRSRMAVDGLALVYRVARSRRSIEVRSRVGGARLLPHASRSGRGRPQMSRAVETSKPKSILTRWAGSRRRETRRI